MQEREYKKQKKGQKPRIPPTKRGNYLDNMISESKKYPKSKFYNVINEMPVAKPKNARKLYETKRNTFIDDITNPKNKNAVPGVGKYNLNLTLK